MQNTNGTTVGSTQSSSSSGSMKEEGWMESTRKGISQGYEAARKGVIKAESQLEQSIRNNPLVAVAAAVGLGWLTGRLLSSRLGGSERSYRRRYLRPDEFDPARAEH
jgi:ElaB/YqjD/DUF883 family membrane-anchored ribosome-binding protein